MKNWFVRSRWHTAVVLCVIALLAFAFRLAGRGARARENKEAVPAPSQADAITPRVDVVVPRVGGIERVTVQPGSVHAFESVDLYAMVSGYLKSQEVDIGSRVKKGQVLAAIDAPREVAAVAESAALLAQSSARAVQAEALVKAAEADRETAAATVAQTEADIERLVANRRLADAQYRRVKSLYEQNAVDKRLVDEQARDFESSTAAEKTARLAVRTAETRLAGAGVKVEQARADVAEAKAAVGVAEARLEKARVDLRYAQVVAPFDGVVTHRAFHPGAFICSATDGGQSPLLTVARTDLVRVVVRVPDRDVVLTDPGDPVVLTIDGLEGRSFRGTVARLANSEDHTTRTMRVEVDVPNAGGLLRDGMYGRATIELEPPSQRLTVPVGCVVERAGKGRGAVLVVRAGKIERFNVVLGADNGTLAEVESGLAPDDQVVLRSNIPLEPGTAVIAQRAK
ncbi:MAG: efflux RND transporter periplasmic adaptor subunit [Isosphaeraceae bacterium]|nr:efflux RND transporter periplasmic adaptor subunit [Isosphaeraceae bacterium]